MAALAACAFLSVPGKAASAEEGRVATPAGSVAKVFDANPTYDPGKPTLGDIWVDPVHGDDSADGSTRARALKTVKAAISRLPPDTRTAKSGYRIMLAAGQYFTAPHPGDWIEGRKATFQYPIVIQSADGPLKAVLPPLAISRCSYVYVIGVKIVPGRIKPQDFSRDILLHVPNSDHVLVRNVLGLAPGTTKETLPWVNFKGAQSQYLYVEDSEFEGAQAVDLDYVACQYGHVVRSKFHHSLCEAIYVKGGSAGFIIAGNEIWNSRTSGFCAGQGTGFQYMVKPWIHYEAYDVKFVNNVVHDTGGPAVAVWGGYNCLVAYNTCYRVGKRHNAIHVGLGGRGPGVGIWNDECDQYLKAGGWCSPRRYDDNIPSKNVYVFNNVVLNDDGFQTERGHFGIARPVKTPAGSNLPGEARADDGLLIRGNVIWNGPPNHPLFDPTSGAPLGCDEKSLRQDNSINQLKPRLLDPQHGNYRHVGESLREAQGHTIPDFAGGDLPERPRAPRGELCNQPSCDRDGKPRSTVHPGAWQ
jgi:uncharacterized Fe-S cluster protein YjdI